MRHGKERKAQGDKNAEEQGLSRIQFAVFPVRNVTGLVLAWVGPVRAPGRQVRPGCVAGEGSREL